MDFWVERWTIFVEALKGKENVSTGVLRYFAVFCSGLRFEPVIQTYQKYVLTLLDFYSIILHDRSKMKYVMHVKVELSIIRWLC